MPPRPGWSAFFFTSQARRSWAVASGSVEAMFTAFCRMSSRSRPMASTSSVTMGAGARRGAAAAAALDGTGAHHGPLARARRIVEFLFMDQAPDLAWYEAAAREGRTVLSVRPGRGGDSRQVVAVLRAHDAHFINHFGLLATEEFDRWRGPEPRLPDYLLR